MPCEPCLVVLRPQYYPYEMSVARWQRSVGEIPERLKEHLRNQQFEPSRVRRSLLFGVSSTRPAKHSEHRQVLVACLHHPFRSRCDACNVVELPSFGFCATLDEKDEQSKRSFHKPRCRQYMQCYHGIYMCDFFEEAPVIA
jgi:hypothetical protein